MAAEEGIHSEADRHTGSGQSEGDGAEEMETEDGDDSSKDGSGTDGSGFEDTDELLENTPEEENDSDTGFSSEELDAEGANQPNEGDSFQGNGESVSLPNAGGAVPAMEAVSQIPVIIPAVKTAAAPILITVVPRGEPVPEAEAVLEAETITVPPEAAEPVMIWEPAAVITAIRKAAEAPTVVTEAAVIPQKVAVPATATAPAMEMSENQWFLSQMPKQMYIMYTATWRSRIRICV